MIPKEIPCILLTGYNEFHNGSTGCILVVDWNTYEPSVFLFNSSEREQNVHNGLLSAEVEMLARYKKECEKDGRLLMAPKEAYQKYGVARMCGDFMSAHIADLVCENLNINNHGRFDTRRTREMLAGAHLMYTNRDLEDELLAYLDDSSEWQRSILEQPLLHILDNYDHKAWINDTLIKIRMAFADHIKGKITAVFGVDYGYRLATAYAQNSNVRWWRVLERTVSMKYPEEGIKYADCSFQEIIAFYGLAKYIAANMPLGNLTLGVEKVPLEERVKLFDLYKKNLENECLDELQHMDNPDLSQMPTKLDAQKAAIERRKKNLGRVPDWLPETVRQDYITYEKAFNKDIKTDEADITYTGFKAYIIKDHKKVMNILMLVEHIGNAQMPLMIKFIQALQELKYIKSDCFDNLPSFVKNAGEQFKTINFDIANVRKNIEPRKPTSAKSNEDRVKSIIKYLIPLLES